MTELILSGPIKTVTSRPKNVALICRQVHPLGKSGCKIVHCFSVFIQVTHRVLQPVCDQDKDMRAGRGNETDFLPRPGPSQILDSWVWYCGFNHGFFILSLDLCYQNDS